MQTKRIDFSVAHPSWHECLMEALACMDRHYLAAIMHSSTVICPCHAQLLHAFSLPLAQTSYLLFGESPYPRLGSANGYAFWDAAVTALWSKTGLSTRVNRATSLRNMIKMLLVAEGLLLPQETGQLAIAQLDKTTLVQTNTALFTHFLHQGFLLLNATLVWTPATASLGTPTQHARAWIPFVKTVLNQLLAHHRKVTILLFGNLAHKIKPLISKQAMQLLQAEHPYNASFITNQAVLDFFQPLHLLRNKD